MHLPKVSRWPLAAFRRARLSVPFLGGKANTLAHSDPAFRHQRASLVDAGALRDQPLAHPVECLRLAVNDVR